MVVLVMVSAVAAGTVVTPMLFVPVTFKVPPPVAENTEAVPFREIPHVKLKVAPALVARFIPVLLVVPVMLPVKFTVPPFFC
jgi:hypothetical protein